MTVTERVQTLTDANFDAGVIQRKGLVLVDFWAAWCGPCRTLAPLLEELAGDYAGEVVVAKVNADDNRAVSEQCVVRGLPTLILFRDGLEVDRVVGAAGKTRIAAVLDKQLEA